MALAKAKPAKAAAKTKAKGTKSAEDSGPEEKASFVKKAVGKPKKAAASKAAKET